MNLTASLLPLLLPLLSSARPNDAGKPVSNMVPPTNPAAAKFPAEPPSKDSDLSFRARQDGVDEVPPLSSSVSGADLAANIAAATQTFPAEPPLQDPGLSLRIRQDEAGKEPLIYVATLPEAKPEDDPFVKETTEFLRKQSLDFDKNVVISKNLEDKVVAWAGLVPLNNTALDEIKRRDGIKEVFETTRGKRRLTLPKVGRREVTHLKTDAGLSKRAPGPSGWFKQELPSFNLKVVSQFPGQEMRPDLNYVYEKHGGAKNGGGVFIYILENGIQLNARNAKGPEFLNLDRAPNGNIKVLQTVLSANNGEFPGDDNHDPNPNQQDPGSHGTRVASVALGAAYGIAKHATLVSVKWHYNGVIDDQAEALRLVLHDIVTNNRQDRAVVLITIGDPGPSPANARDTFGSAAKSHYDIINELMNLGVPVVAPSGNDRSGDVRSSVDYWPPMWASPIYPLIVVGETDEKGIRPLESQAGIQVTTWAPGDGAICLSRDGSVEPGSGSSLAAAMVAGVVATFMSYDEEPWGAGLQGIARTKRIEQYFRSDDATGYKRIPNGERVVWNSADHGAHQSAELDPNGAPSTCSDADICLENPPLSAKTREYGIAV